MKTATVRDLRNHYAGLLDWIAAGEEILITRRGKPVARLVPESVETGNVVDWEKSPALLRDRANLPKLSDDAVAEIMKESGGKW